MIVTAISEDQNYRETVRGVRAFMGWSYIPDLEYFPTSRADNPWIGHRSQPVGKVSVNPPLEDWLCKKLENMNLVLIEGYPSKSSEPGGLHIDQYLRPPKSQNRWYGIHPAEPKDITRSGRYVTSWPNDAAKLNNAFTRIGKPSATTSQPSSRPIAQDTLRKWEKAAKETSYICNQSAGFNRCITKIQDSVQEQLKILQTELGKSKSSSKAQAALDELHYLTTFNQNVSFAVGKSLQHLSDNTFIQMANLTFVRIDSYLEHLKPAIKPDTFSVLRNCPLNTHALFPDAVIRKAEDEIAQFETLSVPTSSVRAVVGSPAIRRGSRIDINLTPLLGNKVRIQLRPVELLEKKCPLGNPLGGGGGVRQSERQRQRRSAQTRHPPS